ncbi:MAG TPA: CesT family type III secretion system chaperone [Rhabdochlamydiaceae bacterium]|nr:CesT family type III secretion system chaperone [Rhabdochlamydiaceae bacterium]
MSYENAKANLKEFGKELNLEGLQFDENHTCILGIDNTFSLHITYEPHSDRLYLYSPILDGLPKDTNIRLKLYENILEGSMLGGQMAGGGIGVATNEELILMHCVIEMGIGADPSALRRFAPIFVEAVERWRKKAKDISEGREPEPDKGPGQGMRPGQPSGGQQPGQQGKPGQPFIKI